MNRKLFVVLLAVMGSQCLQLSAQRFFHRLDSMLTVNYNKGGLDTAYIVRPATKWTVKALLNVSGATIEAKGQRGGIASESKLNADNKATLSLGVSYLGFSLSAALNPAKLVGKYRDYELNFNCYGKRFGFDFIYQDAKNFKGWNETDGVGRIDLPEDVLRVKTINVNAYYAFNGRRFSYPAAFSQSYIQRRSAGSFMLAASLMRQRAHTVDDDNDDNKETESIEDKMNLKLLNIGIGGGYGYNYVPGRGWLLHISALPTFIVYSKTSMTWNEVDIPMEYNFPELIVTGRLALVRQWGNKFFGLSSVLNYTNTGDTDNLAILNAKWRVRAFFGVRF